MYSEESKDKLIHRTFSSLVSIDLPTMLPHGISLIARCADNIWQRGGIQPTERLMVVSAVILEMHLDSK